MSNAEQETADLTRADPEDVDKDAMLALGECPTHGENALATARVEDSVYIAECSNAECDHGVRAPVVDKDGSKAVLFDREPEDVPLP